MSRLIFILFLFFPIATLGVQDISSDAFSFMLEPFLGYNKQSTTGSGTEEGEAKNLLFGTRLGGQFVGVQTGIDYRVATGNYFTTQGQRKYEYSQTAFGVFLGYATPFLLRPYFILQLSTKASIIPNNTVRTLRGKGRLFGLSLFLSVCSLNLEYLSTEWNSIEEGGATRTLSDTDSKGVNFSVSWPFNF
ncbi:MAG: hypothetical protein AABY86_14700 [Bdellovibrionota bacterium]